MNSNPILEEVWRIKDELGREAGHDLHRLCENTRQWAAAHWDVGPVVLTAEELRRLGAAEPKRVEEATPMPREEPPRER